MKVFNLKTLALIFALLKAGSIFGAATNIQPYELDPLIEHETKSVNEFESDEKFDHLISDEDLKNKAQNDIALNLEFVSENEINLKKIFEEKGITSVLHSIILNYMRDKYVFAGQEKYNKELFLKNVAMAKILNGTLTARMGKNHIPIVSLTTGIESGALRGHTDMCTGAIVLKDNTLASCSNDKTIKIWETTAYTCLQTLIGHEFPIVSICQLPNGNLVSVCEGHTIKIWDLTTNMCFQTLQANQRITEITSNSKGDILCARFFGDGEPLVFKPFEIDIDKSVVNKPEKINTKCGCCCTIL